MQIYSFLLNNYTNHYNGKAMHHFFVVDFSYNKRIKIYGLKKKDKVEEFK